MRRTPSVPGTARGIPVTGMLEFRDYLRMVQRHWVMVVLIVCAGLAAAIAATLLMTPRYQAATEIYVSVLGERQATQELVQGSDFARKSVVSYVRVATSDSVLVPVIEELGLTETGRELAQDVEARAPKDTSMVTIVVTRDDPLMAARLADAIGASLTRVIERQLEGPEANGTSAAGRVRLTTVQPAIPPAGPISPRPAVNLALGLFGGLLVGVGIAVVRATLDTRLRSAEDVAEMTDVPVVGEIAFDKGAKSSPLIVRAHGLDPRAESFKALRTNLRFLARASDSEGGRSLVFSSGSPGEGKSTTTANLAIALAEAGARVVLVDGDLRHPQIANYMGIDGAIGLSDVLIGQQDVREVVQRWGSHQLYVLASGALPPNPSELLESAGMRHLMTELVAGFDFVLIDAPPVLVATDASVIGSYTDGVVYLVAAGRTDRRTLDDGLRTLAAGGARVWGIVLSMVPLKHAQANSGVYATQPQPRSAQDRASRGAPTRVAKRAVAK